jgi:hypothetical protein
MERLFLSMFKKPPKDMTKAPVSWSVVLFWRCWTHFYAGMTWGIATELVNMLPVLGLTTFYIIPRGHRIKLYILFLFDLLC